MKSQTMTKTCPACDGCVKQVEATRDGKRICPFADQDEEIWNGREDCLKTMHELSLGIDTDSTLAVQKNYLSVLRRALIRGLGDVWGASCRLKISRGAGGPWEEECLEKLRFGI